MSELKQDHPAVSVVLMARNESHNIEEFFRTVEGVINELVVVDTGSTDGTPELIRQRATSAAFQTHVFSYLRGARLHEGMARQFGVEQTHGEYVFILDADERLSDGFKKNLKPFLREKKPLLMTIPRVDELVPHFIDVMPNRFFKKDGGARIGLEAKDEVHFRVLFSGEKAAFPEPVIHVQGINHWLRRPQRILSVLAREIEDEQNTRGLLRETARGTLGFFYKFRKSYFHQNARADGWAGFKFSCLKGLYVLLGHVFIGLKPRVRTK